MSTRSAVAEGAPRGGEHDGEYGLEAANRAADAVRARVGGVTAPVAVIVLGSGLGALAGRIEGARRVPFAEVPGFPAATVAGHAGALIAGTLAGREVVALAGRFHLYEGHPAALAAFPVRVLHALGVSTLVVSNAAGGLGPALQRGDLMRIDDHIDLMWRNPFAGSADGRPGPHAGLSVPYDRALGVLLHAVARDAGIPLSDGVYAGLLGPAYETPAEVRMLQRLGADAVGMSTVPEVLVARALGMRVAGVSCITNLACGLQPGPLDHAEVLETTAMVAARFQRLVMNFVARL